MDSAAILDAVGVVLRERFAEAEKALAALRITRVEQVGATALLVFGDGSTKALTLPAGERGAMGERGMQGERGAPGENGERGEAGAPGPVGERGERGERGAPGVGIESVEQDESEPDGFTLRLSNGEAVDVALPRGPAGACGERGAPGADRFIAAPRCVADGERVEKNDLIAWGGGILQAIRTTSRDPAEDPASYVCVVAGIFGLDVVENMDTRTYDVTARLTDGTEQAFHFRALPRLLGDGPRPGERIIKGDQFVKGDWLYTATADSADPMNPDAGGWRRQHLRGKRGEDGERGPAGVPGVGITDVKLDGAVIVVTLSTGEEKYLDARALVGVAA